MNATVQTKRILPEERAKIQNQVTRKTLAIGMITDESIYSITSQDAKVIQTRTKKTCAPSGKPSVLANQARIIVFWDLDPSQEASRVPDLLDQAGELGTLKTALFDAGYHAEGVLTATTERGIELRCPAGRTLPDGNQTQPGNKPYSKAQFTYDAARDSYRCPAGAQLTRSGNGSGKTPQEGYLRCLWDVPTTPTRHHQQAWPHAPALPQR